MPFQILGLHNTGGPSTVAGAAGDEVLGSHAMLRIIRLSRLHPIWRVQMERDEPWHVLRDLPFLVSLV